MGKGAVLVVSERYWPDGSGGELATHLIVGMLKERFDVIVVTGSPQVERHKGVAYIYDPLLSRREKILLWPNVERLAHKEKFRELLRSADIVYVPRFAFPVIPVAKKLGKKVIVHLHDYIPLSYTATVLAPFEDHKYSLIRDDVLMECMKGLKHCLASALLWWLPKLARRWIAEADKIICVSRRQSEIIAEMAPELEEKIEVVYNPLPPELLNAKIEKELDETPTFLYVGGDSYIKGFHVLLQAINQIGKRGIRAKFMLINKYGRDALNAIKHLEAKYPTIKIKVFGRTSHSEVMKLHRIAWALIFPSISEEPLPYAVVEAVALGTIPIASRVGGVPEIVGKDGVHYLFSPQNVEEFTSKIAKVIMLPPSNVVKIGFFLRKKFVDKLSKETNDITKVFS